MAFLSHHSCVNAGHGLYTFFAAALKLRGDSWSRRETLAMTTFQYTSGVILMVLGSAATWGGATASDATLIGERQRVAAIVAAQRDLGYAPVVDHPCCCADAVHAEPDYATIGQQIERLSAALQEPAPRVEPSAAALAAGAY
jgi:hypothetical protein